ncbi:SH3 domain-containing protein [Stenotrophomonas acidaminiphila]|uniref:SH3 domain-containing protein n=1 Tax=Stenotrophomonas acidaminiphila TaxID=128780 RepID=UPI002ABE0EAE|nr:SH3 domain-containing protein [Stenotrophomonas acidaminiphila]WPU56459.1 SH3 domain-containing protein [Stenotrophomonas acidaminiphila]
MPRLIPRLAAAAAIIAVVLWFQPEIVEPPAKVSGSGLNLRSAPDTRADRVAVLPVGTTVEVQRCLGDLSWCNVRHGEQSGWVAADYLIARADGRRVKVAEAGRELGVVIETAKPGG